MRLLREDTIRSDIALLDDAWSDPASFLLLPNKLGVSEKWLGDALKQVPESLRQAHFVMLTSGTTGDPKLVIGSRLRAERLAATLHEQQCSEAVDATLLLLPLSYTYAFVNQWLWARVKRRRLQVTTGLADPGDLGNTLEATRNAMLCLVGIQLPLLLMHLGGRVFPGVIRVHFAGGRFPQERLGALHEMFPNAWIFNNYGCAEAMPRLTLRRAEEAGEAANIGRPLPGIELRCGVDHALQFRSPYGAVGIIEEGQFRPIDDDEWTATGDLAEPAEGGSWRLLGRPSEVFKRHGEKVSLPLLTSTVTRAWAGQCAFHRETDRLGEDGCVLSLAPVPGPDDLRRLLLALRKGHPRSHWPLRIEAMDILPLLANGKIDTRKLADFPGKISLWRQHI
jgi:acyl-CoA synthetase (AMP-forming)/AMP-acid ligase II